RDDRGALLEGPGETADGAGGDARARLIAHYASESVDCLRGAGIPWAELFEERQAVGDQDPAGRGRRIREVLLTAEGRADRSSADDTVLLEISFRDAAAVVAYVFRDREIGRASCRERV